MLEMAVAVFTAHQHGEVLGPDDLAIAGGKTWRAEIVVLACHLAIAKFLPTLEEALVPVADQWSRIGQNGSALCELDVGTFWSAGHGYEWGGRTASGELVAGGARYLRPMAGIGASAASYETSIAEHLEKKLGETFVNMPAASLEPGNGELDCRPCDELPIVGPMFGESRLLLATGYMGNGLVLGFMAGRCLAELIVHGKSDVLPRRLWPERLRTMEVRR